MSGRAVLQPPRVPRSTTRGRSSPGHPDTPERLGARSSGARRARLAGLGAPPRRPAASEARARAGARARARARGARAVRRGRGADRPRHGRSCRRPGPRRCTPPARACEMTRALLAGDARVGLLRDPALRPPRRTRAARWASACSTTSPSRRRSRCAELGLSARVRARLGRPPRQRHRRDLPRPAATCCSRACTSRRCIPGTGPLHDAGTARGRATRSTCPCRPAPGRSCGWSCSTVSSCRRRARTSRELVLVSAGFDAHAGDPLAHCLLETDSFVGDGGARRGRSPRELGVGARAGAGGRLRARDPGRVRVCACCRCSRGRADPPAGDGWSRRRRTPLAARRADAHGLCGAGPAAAPSGPRAGSRP